MANVFKPKRSNSANTVPTTSNLTSGEMGVNMADQKIYINNGTSVVQIGTGKLSGAEDVTLTSLTSGQTLQWNGTAWVNVTGSGSSTLTVGTTATSGGAAGQIMFDTGSVLQESSALTFASNTLQINGANILGGTNSFTLGGAAAASPSAQIIRAQSVSSGTSNTAGANLTITGSQGTGTGAGGSIIFQVAPAGSSGTAQNALSTALTLNSSGTLLFTTSTYTTGLGFNIFDLNNRFDMYYPPNTAWRVAASSTFSDGPSFQLFGGTNANFPGQAFFDYGSTARALGQRAIWFRSATNTTTVNVFNLNAAGDVGIGSGQLFGWSSTTDAGGTKDTIISRRGAANLRFGAADAAAPVAQTLSVQSVVAGTSNTAGANLTITGSQGTGTGAGGDIIFQVAPAGSTGTAQNALTTALTIRSNATLMFNNISAATISADAAFLGFAGLMTIGHTTSTMRLSSSLQFGFTGGTSINSLDTILTRRAAANLRFGAADAAAPVAQTLSVQSVVAGTSNTAGANLTITGSQGTGTGAGGAIIFQVAPAGSSGTAQNALSTALTISGARQVYTGSPSSALLTLVTTANAFMVSGTSTTLYAMENTAASSSSGGAFAQFFANSGAALVSNDRMGGIQIGGSSSSSTLRNAAAIIAYASQNWVDGTANGSRLGFETTTNGSTSRTVKLIVGNSGIVTFGATEANTVPALKPSSTILQVRLADDSAYAPVEALSYSLSTDVLLTRRGAANLRFGAADAAAPVAQTLSVQSVVAGTTNTAGVDLTITGSQGTGTGAGGSIIFQTAPAGSSGTAQNALVSAVAIDSQGDVGIGTTNPLFLLHVSQNSNGNISNDVYVSAVTGASYLGRKARGSSSSPSAALSDDYLVSMTARGYGATGFGANNVGSLGFYAAENFTDTAQGAYFALETTPTGSTTRAERMRVTAAGKIVFGSSVAYNAYGTGNIGRVQSHGTSQDGSAFNSFNWSSTGASSPAILSMSKSRSGTIGTQTAVSSGNDLGWVQFNGSDGTDFVNAVRISGECAGTVSTGVVPGRFVVSTATLAGALNEAFRVNAAGELIVASAGVSTDNGAYNLQCNGTSVWGAGAYVNGSDVRIKEDIAPIGSCLDIVQQLNPVTFRYKQDWSKDQSIQPGFIAQELLATLSGTNYVDGIVQQGPEYYSVAYQSMIPILTKALQELKAEFDAYKASHP